MKKPLFNKICIVGVGLIGGSLGMAIKKRSLARWVIGVVRREATAKDALRRKALDVATFNLREGVEGADLVILCGPISVIVDQLRRISKWASPKTLVIDVGSSKSLIDRVGAKYLKSQFVGCHPMAGSSKRGVGSVDANADLFQGQTSFITSPNAKIKKLWHSLGCKVITKLDSKKHDEWVAGPSYLTHVAACAMLRSEAMRKLARFGLKADNPSFKDTARLSKCDPELWADILLSNAYSVKHLAAFEKSVSEFRKALASKNRMKLKKLITDANHVSWKLAGDERQ